MSLLYRAMMWLGSWWCHQLPARSPHLWGAQLPLCWRCSGILVGAVALFIWLVARKRFPSLALSVALALPLPLDVLHAVVTGGDGDNARRFLTGVLWGIFGTAACLKMLAALWKSAKISSVRRGGVPDTLSP